MSRAFLGWVDENKVKPSSLVVPRKSNGGTHLAAIWPWGPGGAPHKLTVGGTGGGKTSEDRLIIADLMTQPARCGFCLIDGEGAGEFTMFHGRPGVKGIVNVNPAADQMRSEEQKKNEPSSVQLAVDMIASVLAEVLERNAAMMAAQAAWADHLTNPERFPAPTYTQPAPLFFAIDGWMSLCWDINRHLKRVDPVSDAIQIGRIGRKVDVHLMLATQRPDAKSIEAGLPGELKAQLGCKIATVGPLGLTKVEAQMAFDDSDAGRELPKDERGHVPPGGCLVQMGNLRVPFMAPPMVNPTTADPSVSVEDRRAVWRLLPPREAA